MEPESTSDQPQATKPEEPKQLKRRQPVRSLCLWCVKAWLGRFFVLGLVLLTASLFIFTRTPAAKLWIVPQIERALGAEIDTISAAITRDGSISLQGLSVRVPGLDGVAGEILTADAALIGINYRPAGGGPPSVERVALRSPLLRASIDPDTDQFNIAGLKLGGGGGSAALPNVTLSDGRVEIGEHNQLGGYTRLKELDVEGRLLPISENGQSGYDVFLAELDADEGEAMHLSGRAGQDEIEVRLNGIDLNDWPPETAPRNIRPIMERLALAGRVENASFIYNTAPDGTSGITAELSLASVGVSLPFGSELNQETAQPGDAQDQARAARMRDVSGRVRFSDDRFTARLEGYLEDLPYEVDLAYDGISLDAPFLAQLTTRAFRLEANPQLLPFVPDAVERRLEQFSSPTALVDAEVRVERLSQGADLNVTGWLQFSGGVASYESFPYEFRDMAGVVIFDPVSVEIAEVTGRAANGATVVATGEFSPPDSTSGVELDIRVRDLPIDDALARALGSKRDVILTSLFNREKFAELEADGVTQTAEEKLRVRRALDSAEAGIQRALDAGAPVRGELVQERDRLAAAYERPVFDFGAKGSIDIRLNRQVGVVSIWDRSIVVTLEDVGALPEFFPLPLVTDRIVIDIDSERALVENAKVSSAIGGEVEVNAEVLMNVTGADAVPRIQLRATDIPMSPLVVRAIPDPEPADSDASVRRMLNEMNIAGQVEADIDIGPRNNTPELGYDVTVRVAGATATPAPADVRADDGRTVALDEVNGTVLVNEKTVELDLTGRLMHLRPGYEPLRCGTVRAQTIAELRPDQPAILDVIVEADDVELSAPMEDLGWVFARNAGVALDASRQLYQPSGLADMLVNVSGDGEGLSVNVDVWDMRGVDFDWYEGRARFDGASGSVRINAGPRPVAHIDQLAGALSFNGDLVGQTWLNGTVTLPADPDAPGEPVADSALDVRITQMPAQSPFVSSVVRISAPPAVRELYELHKPRGPVDADLYVRPAIAVENSGFGVVPEMLEYTPVVEGQLLPSALTVDYLGTELEFSSMTGAVVFGPGWSILDQLGGSEDGWSTYVSGQIMQNDPPEGDTTKPTNPLVDHGVTTDLTIDLYSDGLPETLVAILPPKLQQSIETMEVGVGGTVRGEGLTLHAERGQDPHEGLIEFAGTLRMTEVDAVVGGKFTDVNTDLSFTSTVHGWFGLEPERPIPQPEFAMDITGATGRAAGIRFTGGAARAETLDAPPGMLRPLVAPSFGARVHGGRVSGSAYVRPIEPANLESLLAYETTVRAIGLDTEAVSADLNPEATPIDDPSGRRGVADTEVTLAGIVGDDPTRRGRGTFRARGGELIAMPLVTALIEVSNLVPPLGDRMEVAAADFYMAGETIVFEELSLLSSSVLLFGYGTASWPELELDLRVRSQAVTRVPLLSDLVEGLRDELLTVRVGGSVKEPAVGVESLPTTRRIFGGMFGSGISEDERAMARILDRVRERVATGQAVAGRSTSAATQKPTKLGRGEDSG